MTNLVEQPLATPIGELTLVANERALVAVLWPTERDGRVRFSSTPQRAENSVLAQAATELGEYFAGTRRSFDVVLDPHGTEFQRQVWWSLRDIPYGETTTYAKQAVAVGRPSAVRAVGSANGRNPLSIVLPCHRVVGSNGSLAGFAGGLDTKRWLLDHETTMAQVRH